MTKFPVVDSSKVIKALRKAGFEDAPKRGKGSHIALIKHDNDQTRLVIIPKRDPLPKGTLLAILKQAGLTKTQFLELLKI